MKLYQHSRNGIVNRLMEHKFAPLELLRKMEEDELATDIYLSIYTAEHIKFMASAPDGFMCKNNYVQGQIGGRYEYIYFFNADGTHRDMPVAAGNKKVFLLESSSPLGIRAHKLRQGNAKLMEEKEKAKAAALAAVNSCSTTEKLLAMWPEIEPFLPKTPEPARALVVRPEELNAVFGLPVGESAGA